MDKSILAISIISILSVVIFFVVDNIVKEPLEPIEKKTWYFIPVDYLSLGEVGLSDKLIAKHETGGYGVYSTTIDVARAVPIELKSKLVDGSVIVDLSMCAESKR